MTPHTQAVHLAALRAAARLALSAAVPAFVFACGGAEAPDPAGSTGSTATDTAGQGSADTSGGDLRASTPKAVKTYCAAVHSYESTEACCKAEVAKAHFPSDPKRTGDPDLRVDAVTRGCCVVLANASIKEQTPWAERGQCCPAIGWNGVPSCTPWGPPVPPKMSATFIAVA